MALSLRAIAALAVTTLLAGRGGAQIFPTPPTGYGVGSLPHSVAIGDFDHDGNPDIVAANEFSNSVTVRLGAGAGSFGAPTNYAVGSHPYEVDVADLNGDGILDLATANHNSNDVSVLLGAGGGGFLAQTTYAASNHPNFLAIGDLNGDGRPDLVTSDEPTPHVSVLLNLGGGAFAAPTSIALGTGTSYTAGEIAIADMNGDGRLDLVVAADLLTTGAPPFPPDYVCVLLGTGTGSFGAPMLFQEKGRPRGVAIGDLNGDGIPDVATADLNGSAGRLLGTGGGSLAVPVYFLSGLGPSSVAIGDLDGNGILDLAVSNFGLFPTPGNSVSILVGLGGANFSAATSIVVGSEPMGLALADLNKDGRLDLAVANLSSNNVAILLNGLPTFPGLVAYGTGTSGCAGQLTLNGNSTPSITNPSFAIIGSNAPHNTLGALIGTDASDVVGTDLFGIGVKMHFSLVGATQLLFSNIYSGPSGEQFTPSQVPSSPAMIGKSFYLQSIWVEPADTRCTPGLVGLEGSRGLAVTIQP